MTLRSLNKSIGAGAAAALSTLVACLSKAFESIAKHSAFALAFVATVVFYYPSLRNHSIDAGWLYTGDVLGIIWPSLAKTHALVSSFNFTGIDFSAYNGSSDYFLAPNFTVVHPLLVAYSLVFAWARPGMQDFGYLLVLITALHSFCACYFSQKLLTRFFNLDFGQSALAAFAFAFSFHMALTMQEPQFLFCVTMMPCAVYGALAFASAPSLRALLWASIPVVVAFLAGYVPLGVASMGVSLVLVAISVLVMGDRLTAEARVRSLLLAFSPFLLASIVVGPYFLAIYNHLKATVSADDASLFFSAHQLAQLPQSLLNHVATRMSVPGPIYQSTFSAGVIAVAVGALFFFSRAALRTMTDRDWNLMKACAGLYVVFVLATFGTFSPVSDLVYYFVPQVGGMHIYQRFLLLGQFFLAVSLAIMLRAVLDAKPDAAVKIMTAVMVVLTVVAAHIVAHSPDWSDDLGLNNHVVLELFTGLLFLLALAAPGRRFAYATAIAFMLLPALGLMYEQSRDVNTFAEQRKLHAVALNDEQRGKLVAYLKRFSDKEVIKYVDLTPLWDKDGREQFPKAFPYFVLDDLRLSSYSGFEFRMSPRAEYMRRMPMEYNEGWVMRPDWDLVARQGADFLVAYEDDLKEGAMSQFKGKVQPADVFRLPNGIVVIPLRTAATKASKVQVFDNGIFRISPTDSLALKLVNVALGKPASQSSTIGNREARLAVDGITDGELDHGSIAHTGQDVNAWLDIDLGASQAIHSIGIWNITTCCQYRLRDFWIFVSDEPFKPGDTAALLRARPNTWSKVNATPKPHAVVSADSARGRYVRVQLGGNQPVSEAFLHLAEVEVFAEEPAQAAARAKLEQNRVPLKVLNFETNFANALTLQWESGAPSTVQYLFSGNPRLHYYLNGEDANVTQRDGLFTIDAPAGRYTLKVRYRHWELRLFWLLFALYAAACLWAVAVTGMRLTRRPRQRLSSGPYPPQDKLIQPAGLKSAPMP